MTIRIQMDKRERTKHWKRNVLLLIWNSFIILCLYDTFSQEDFISLDMTNELKIVSHSVGSSGSMRNYVQSIRQILSRGISKADSFPWKKRFFSAQNTAVWAQVGRLAFSIWKEMRLRKKSKSCSILLHVLFLKRDVSQEEV